MRVRVNRVLRLCVWMDGCGKVCGVSVCVCGGGMCVRARACVCVCLSGEGSGWIGCMSGWMSGGR